MRKWKRDFRRFVRKNEKRLAEKQTARREACRMQLEQEAKCVPTMAGSSIANVAKTHEQEIRELKVQLINGGALQYARASPLEEPKLAWELAGNLMASREIGQRDEPPSLAAREGPPEVERARQRRELQLYLERPDPTVLNDVLGQFQPPGGPLTMRFRRSAR